MNEFAKKDFEKLLKHGGLEAHRWMKATDSNVCRIYDRNLEEMPVTVDLYNRHARIVDYSDNGFTDDEVIEIKDIVSRFLYVELANIVFVQRKKREGREQHEKMCQSTKVEVQENSLSFECELSLYADTGLFLDQANTRAIVRENSFNRKVLNLFCYTGAFSVYAASGGAESVTSVDLSNVYSEWAKRNLERNGFLDSEKYEVVTMDAKSFLKEAIEKKRVYDLVILDPPAFSNSHKAEDFDVQKDYLWYISAISKLLCKDGALIFSENLSGFRFDKGKLMPYYNVREITKEVLAQGFTSKRRQLRVWILEKTATMKEEYRAVRKRREMDEELKDESLERLTLADGDFGKEEKRERRKEAPRSYDFRDERSSDRDFAKRGERRDTHSRDHERRRRERFDDRDGRDTYRDRDPRDRGDRDRRDFRGRDDRRGYDRDRYSSRRDFPRDDRRGFSDDRRDFSRRDDDRRYSDRRDFTSREDRRDDRDYRNDNRYERRDYRNRDDRRSFSRDDRRDSRFSHDSDRFSRGRDDRRFRDSEPRKKTSRPKPYGYDSFMETKNREKATAFWLQNQEVAENPED